MRDLPDAANVPICFCGNVPVGHSLAYALNKMERLISYTVTFKVVNGKWNEGEDDAATADKTVTLTGHDGDTLKLTADQIPAVGSKPNDTYKAGSWDTTPSTETEITAATTYTYTYAQKSSISQTVTFKVVNGSWDDETTTDKTVTLTGYEGDTLKLAANQIPSVGTKPNDTYKAGSWDTTPSAEIAITGATTYTYTYAAKAAQTITAENVTATYGDTGKSVSGTTDGDICRLTNDLFIFSFCYNVAHKKADRLEVSICTEQY